MLGIKFLHSQNSDCTIVAEPYIARVVRHFAMLHYNFFFVVFLKQQSKHWQANDPVTINQHSLFARHTCIWHAGKNQVLALQQNSRLAHIQSNPSLELAAGAGACKCIYIATTLIPILLQYFPYTLKSHCVFEVIDNYHRLTS